MANTTDFEIRTLQSDLEDIKAGGGSLELVNKPEEQKIEEIESNSSNSLKMIIILISLIIILAGIGYLTYYLLLKILGR